MNATVDRQQYLQFLNAVIASSDHDRAEAAFKKAIASDQHEVATAISQITSIGELNSLRDYLDSRPARIVVLTELTKKVFGDDATDDVIDDMFAIRAESDDSDTDDFYYEQGDDSDGH